MAAKKIAAPAVWSDGPRAEGSSARRDAAAARDSSAAFWIKWGASIIQVMGYAATAFDFTPWNIYLFLVGVLGWFTVGVLWKDWAIILIHLVALVAMIAGLVS